MLIYEPTVVKLTNTCSSRLVATEVTIMAAVAAGTAGTVVTYVNVHKPEDHARR